MLLEQLFKVVKIELMGLKGLIYHNFLKNLR